MAEFGVRANPVEVLGCGRRAPLSRQPRLRLALRLFLAKPLAAPGLVGERLPSRLGSLATLTHVGQHRLFSLGPRLGGAGEEEVVDAEFSEVDDSENKG